MLQLGVQIAHHELLPLSAQRADDLVHGGVVPALAGDPGHQVNVAVAYFLLQLVLLARGDKAASFAGYADVVRSKAVGQRAGSSRGPGQPHDREHADYQGHDSSHVRSLPPSLRSHYVPRGGQTVARDLFPDVLSYVVGTPAVYGFAARNGRTRADNAPEAMLSLVTNTAVPSGLKPAVAQDQRPSSFPYVVPA